MVAIPVVQVLHVCHFVDSSIWLENIRIICQERLVDNSSPMVNLLKMGVSEANEHFFNRRLVEVVVDCLHCVCPHNPHIHAVFIPAVNPKGVDFLGDEVGHFVADFLAKDQVVREVLG